MNVCGCVQENFAHSVIGTVVLTDYNNNTYRIDDVDFSTTPGDSFPMKNGERITYVDYYKKKYGIRISNSRQPMLVTRSRTRDRQAGEGERVYLVPELCRATGTLYHCFISNFFKIYSFSSLFFLYIIKFKKKNVAASFARYYEYL